MVYPGDTFPIGSIVQLGEYIFRTIEITYQGRIFEKITPFESSDFLDQQGTYPLPPYITPSVEAQSLYNTEFATHRGSLAAPTASLHFTK